MSTDVSSYGVNVPHLDQVINFDLPLSRFRECYVHRVGRTGRLGNVGRAISFFDPDVDEEIAPYIAEVALFRNNF